MLHADLGITSGGSTTWERSCLGLSALVISTAQNQVGVARYLDEHGYQKHLGLSEDLTPLDIREALEDLLKNPEEGKKLSKRAFSLVDGEGVSRVSRILTERMN
jgi:spore coat polysaccharide biosynthesis predicted glycosyltransferase SpsG